MSDDDRQDIYQLKEKLQQASGNIAALAQGMGIIRTSLNSMMDTSRMSLDVQEKAAKALNFKTSWPEWRDSRADRNTPENGRRDTAPKFMNRLKHGPPLEIEPGDPECRDWKFASFRIDSPSGQFQDLSTDRFLLLDEVSCEPTDVGAGMIVGLKVFDLNFFLPERPRALLIECSDKRNRGSIIVEARGIARRPFFRYSSAAPPIGERLPPSDALAHYVGAQEGDEIRVTMTAAQNESFVDSRGAELATAKRRKIAEHLAKLQAQGEPDQNGEITLARQSLRIKMKS